MIKTTGARRVYFESQVEYKACHVYEVLVPGSGALSHCIYSLQKAVMNE